MRVASTLHSVEPPRPPPGDGIVQDTAADFDDDVWTVARILEHDEDTQITTYDRICLAMIANVDLPTDPLLQGKWLCACFDPPYWVVFRGDEK